MTIGIYKITNLVNGKIYIGQSLNIEKRFITHKVPSRRLKLETVLYKAFNKYGLENFSFDIIEICDKNQLDTFEKYYILKNKSNIKKYGYNMTDGGSGHSGGLSEAHCKNISKSKLGIKNPMYGKTPTPETLKKRSESLKKVKHTKEWHAKIGAKHKGKILSDETKEKIRQKLLGNKLSDETKTKMSKSQKGRKHSEATKEKLRKPKKIQIIYQYDLQNNLINTFNSLHEASNISGINNAQILAVCKNYKWKKTAGGYKWSYNKL